MSSSSSSSSSSAGMGRWCWDSRSSCMANDCTAEASHKLIHQLLHFAWVADDAKRIVVTDVCVPVCPSPATCPHYCMDPEVTWGNGRGCPPVVHYWADSQSVHGFRCYDNIVPHGFATGAHDNTAVNAKCQRVLVPALCLVNTSHHPWFITYHSVCTRPRSRYQYYSPSQT